MSTPPSAEAASHEVCAVLADVGEGVSWLVRIAAAAVVLERVTGIKPVVVPVRAAAYSRSAVFRLGGAMVPQHLGEVDHFREQVGPAMILLGVADASPHALLSIGQCLVEVAHGADWSDRGVIVRPFARMCAPIEAEWIVEGLRYGVTVAYQRAPGTMSALPAGAEVIAFADTLSAALQATTRPAIGQ